MRVFVTGATGFVGSAVVDELLRAGHEVVGLARSDGSAAKLTARGVEVARGDLNDIESLKRGADRVDAAVHTAFNHDDYSKFQESCANDRVAIEALGEVMARNGGPLIVSSAIGVLPRGAVVAEESRPTAGAGAHPRAATEHGADAAAARGVPVSIVRLPPSVHGAGDPNFVKTLIQLARQKGASVYLDEGNNRWPAVHRLDAARVYRLALERRPAGGCFHAVAEDGIPFRDIATAIGVYLGVPVVAKPREEAAVHFGAFMAHFAALDVVASSSRTRDQLGWTPVGAGLLADIEGGAYSAAKQGAP